MKPTPIEASNSTEADSSVKPACLLIGVLAAAFYALFIARTAFAVDGEIYFSLFDDAMISMTYARNMAEGAGLVWNAGEAPVEGYTNFLWTLWMAALHLLPVPESRLSLLVMISGAAILLANLWVVQRLAMRLSSGSALVTVFAVAGVAAYYPLVYWTLRGMEVGALTLLVDVALLLALRLQERASGRDMLALGGVLAMALLLRMDAAVPYAVIGAFAVWTAQPGSRARLVAWLGACFAVPLGAQTAFRLAYYGEWLPNTYHLKVVGVSLFDRLDRGLRTLVQALTFHFAALLVPVAMLLRERAAWLDARVWLLAALVAGQAAYGVYVGGDAWEWVGHANRFHSVAAPALLLLGGLGLRALLARPAAEGAVSLARAVVAMAGAVAAMRALLLYWHVGPGMAVPALLGAGALLGLLAWKAPMPFGRPAAPLWGFARLRPVLAGLLAVGLLSAAAHHRMLTGWARDNAVHVVDDAAATRLGLAVRQGTRPDAVVAVVWAGAIPYFARREAVDLLGKNDPVIARAAPATPIFFPGHNKWDFEHSLAKLRPDVIVQEMPGAEFRKRADALGYRLVAPNLRIRKGSARVLGPEAWR